MVVLCIPPARYIGCWTISDAGSLCTEIPRTGRQSLSPSLPLPWAVSQLSPQEPVSSRPFPLWQFSGLPAVSILGCLPLLAASRMLQLLQPTGFHSCYGSGLEGFFCFLFSPSSFFLILFVFLLLLLFNLHILELSCWTTPPHNSCQNPLQGDSKSKQETNNVWEKIQSVFGESCYFKGSIEVPLELITVVGEIRQGGSCSVGSQGMEKTEEEKIK